MKCPECAASQKYRDGMTCACGYKFALDPKEDQITDGKFQGMVLGASGNDTNFFTENQLYTQYCRQKYNNPQWLLIVGAALLGLAGGAALLIKHDMGANVALISGLIGAILLLIGIVFVFAEPPDRNRFKEVLRKWQEYNGPLEKLIVEPALHQPPPEWPEPDIYDYGVERLLIVQRDILVDLLVHNNFHSTNSVLIISEQGYPDYLIGPAAKALAANAQLPVYLLHDATEQGVGMAGRLQKLEFLLGEDTTTIDMGIFPEDVRRMRKLQPLRPRKLGYQLPVDSIPYAMLGQGLTEALAQQTSLSALMAAIAVGGSDDVGYGFG